MRQLGEPLAQNRIRTLCLLSEILMSQRKYKEALTLISAELNAAQKFSEFYPKILLFYAVWIIFRVIYGLNIYLGVLFTCWWLQYFPKCG